jgi:hypothetical protein
MKIYQHPQVAYLVGAALVWAGLFAATAMVLGGTPHFGEMLPILVGGAFYFVAIVPGGIVRTMAQPGQPHTPRVSRGDLSKEQLAGRLRERLYLFGALGLIGLLGILFHQPILFLCFLLFGLFALTPRKPTSTHPRPRRGG